MSEGKVNNIEKNLARQRALIQQLNSTITNYAKCAKTKRTLSYYETRLEVLDNLFADISKINISILASSDEEEQVAEYISTDSYGNAEDAYINLKSQIRDAIVVFQPRPEPVVNIAGSSSSSARPDSINVPRINDFRLPTITIPSFNGEYSMWPSYKNSFNHLIAGNQILSNLQRLHYLKSSLKGDALQLIQHYDLADGNYQAAWEKLISRYDNKNFLVAAHLKSLIHYPAQSKDTASNLRSLIDSFTDSVNGLHTLGISTEGWDPIIIYHFIEKVSRETHSLWQASQATNNELPTWNALIIFMENRFRTLEAIADKPTKPHVNPFVSPAVSHSSSRDHKHAHSHTASVQSECALCQHNHYLRACPSFLKMDIETRI